MAEYVILGGAEHVEGVDLDALHAEGVEMWRAAGCTCRPLGWVITERDDGHLNETAVHDERCPTIDLETERHAIPLRYFEVES